MQNALVWEEIITIPTYETGLPEKCPLFLDKRVYQGSSGKVYPYPVIETLTDEKADKPYRAVWLENEYLKVMVLPELGGRIHRAIDKTNGVDFVYFNHVIKPALVGLLGPWISGGIEFNWPQHHRPTTFMPTDFILATGDDGSASVLIHDIDQMYGTGSVTRLTLERGSAYIRVDARLYNPTAWPQTFLWWANPAVYANRHTRSIFPPDVTSVMDHGKRDVSAFPIARGTYYKHDYSPGADISRHWNIPVPTSFMAEKSSYDFMGGYDDKEKTGLLHVADHHLSPGKKQWTWGNGDFGRAWERNLTDDDGPYVELMMGVFTDNQPDFAWLKPYEEKAFTQYFMPYKDIGAVKNASKYAAVNLTISDGRADISVYLTARRKVQVRLLRGEKVLLSHDAELSPYEAYHQTCDVHGAPETELSLVVLSGGLVLVSYHPQPAGEAALPLPAQAAKEPCGISSLEELWLTGLHLEQYRHATYLPEDYYREGLRRDPGDSRLNDALGMLLMRRGLFPEAKACFEVAVKRLTWRNPNPPDSGPFAHLGLALFCLGQEDEAFDAFYKAAWSAEQKTVSFYFLAAISARRGDNEEALSFAQQALNSNAHHMKARALKAWLLKMRGIPADAWLLESIALNPFDFVSQVEKHGSLPAFARAFPEHYLMTARDYAEFGAYREALGVLASCPLQTSLLMYYRAYAENKLGIDSSDTLKQAMTAADEYTFPNNIEDIPVLRFALESNQADAKAPYHLGNLLYDKKRREEAISMWELSIARDGAFPFAHRNLALAYCNVRHDTRRALTMLERAYELDADDARILMELDQLRKRAGQSFAQRREALDKRINIVFRRDDLCVEYVTMLNMQGQYGQALETMLSRVFHPWEGGEGRVTAQYVLARQGLALGSLRRGDYRTALAHLRDALVYPENLGEGKLESNRANNIHYYMGLALRAMGEEEEAARHLDIAAEGIDEPAGMLYYNDQPADMMLYQGLASRALGREQQAVSIFHKLIDYGEKHGQDRIKPDYFAVSLPDLQLFDEDLSIRNRAHCEYLIALGSYGLGDRERARRAFAAVLDIDCAHQGAVVHSLLLNQPSGPV